MGFLFCRCGKDISLRDIPYDAEAGFLPQRDEKAFTEACAAEIAAFVAAVASGKRAEWITAALSEHSVQRSDQAIIHEILHDRWQDRCRSLLECSVCGRIYLESSRPDGGFIGFRPEPVTYTPSRTLPFEQAGNAGFTMLQTKPASSNWFDVDSAPAPAELRGDYGHLINRERQTDTP